MQDEMTNKMCINKVLNVYCSLLLESFQFNTSSFGFDALEVLDS